MSTQTFTPDPVYVPVAKTRVDAASGKRPEFKVIQPTTPYTGAPIEPIQTGLPKITESLCPECCKLILADIFADTG